MILEKYSNKWTNKFHFPSTTKQISQTIIMKNYSISRFCKNLRISGLSKQIPLRSITKQISKTIMLYYTKVVRTLCRTTW